MEESKYLKDLLFTLNEDESITKNDFIQGMDCINKLEEKCIPKIGDLAERYADTFRLVPETKSWYQQKVDDFTAGFNACKKII